MPKPAAALSRRLLTRASLLGLVLLAFALGVQPVQADTLIIDDFEYASDAAAQAAWLNRGGSPKVTMADSGEWGTERVMKLPCDFSTLADRRYWDRLGSFDLSGYPMFALELYVPDHEAVSRFTLYFHSGSGWYKHSPEITRSGWQTLTVSVTDFEIEGAPGGWDQVDTIRLSPWRESEIDTELAVRELRAYTPLVLIFHDTLAENGALASRSAQLIDFFLGKHDVSRGVVAGSAMDDGYLAGSRIAVLPYNEVITPPQMTALEQFVYSGGKLMVHYLLHLDFLLFHQWT